MARNHSSCSILASSSRCSALPDDGWYSLSGESSAPVRKRSRMPSTDDEGASTSAPSEAESDDDGRPQRRELVLTRRQGRRPPRRAVRRIGQTTTVVSAIAALRLANEVEELRRRRDELMTLQLARLLNSENRDIHVSTTIQYYDTFRIGFHGSRLPQISQYMNSRIDRSNFQYGMTELGFDGFVEQWRRYMRLFPSLSLRIRSTTFTHLVDPLAINHHPNDSSTTTCLVEAQATMGGVVSREAIGTLFPHLRHREDLVLKLLEKPFDCPMTMRFYFNSSGRVTRLDLDADFFNAFVGVEGVGLIDAVQIMERAAIGDNSTVPAVADDGRHEGLSIS